jgi:hypothetical protein
VFSYQRLLIAETRLGAIACAKQLRNDVGHCNGECPQGVHKILPSYFFREVAALSRVDSALE